MNFVDIAARAGLTAKTEAGGVKSKKYIIETTGGGAAFEVGKDFAGLDDLTSSEGLRPRRAAS